MTNPFRRYMLIINNAKPGIQPIGELTNPPLSSEIPNTAEAINPNLKREQMMRDAERLRQ